MKYDKLFVDLESKKQTAIDEKIDLFIDDSPKHCQEVSKLGIKVIMMDAKYNKNNNEFIHMSNWQEIYEYIQSR